MKKIFLILFAALLVSTMILSGYAESKEPVRGGILRVIYGPGHNDLSYAPDMSMTDEFNAKGYVETLVSWDGKGEFVPNLAESWNLDPKNKTITFHLRKGVKFHDGTDLNAEAIRWNMQLMLDNKRFINGQALNPTKPFEVLDNYTFRFNLSQWLSPSVMLHSYAYVAQIYSPTAFKKNGKQWCYTHFVTTGPFKFVSFERDVLLKMERFDGYWRKGYPLLDGVEFIYVADPMTAAAKMQAKEADEWVGPPLKEAVDLEKTGFAFKAKNNMFNDIVPDNKTPGSVYQKKEVREAIEYALNRPAIAKGLGYGKLRPMNQMAPEGTQGYNPNYTGRPYNPDKARQLLKAAGYPNGFKTKMLVLQMPTSQDLAVAIQKYLKDVGIEVELDVADPGRFFGKMYKDGWDGNLLLMMVPVDPEYAIGWLVHFGPQPIVFYSSLQWPEKYSELVNKVYFSSDRASLAQATKEMIMYVNEEAMIIPVTQDIGTSYVAQPYVHTDRLDQHFMVWYAYKDWMEKH
ncbi:MAG: ABC transporter substrate-binding protein [Thermodesulfobacteriota bacterium]|jgi:peptide/nickel transport system substrate-binding protein